MTDLKAEAKVSNITGQGKVDVVSGSGDVSIYSRPRLEELEPLTAWVFDDRLGYTAGDIIPDGTIHEDIWGTPEFRIEALADGLAEPGEAVRKGPTYLEDDGYGYIECRTLTEDDSGQYGFREADKDHEKLDFLFDSAASIFCCVRKQEWKDYGNEDHEDSTGSPWGMAYGFDRENLYSRQAWSTEYHTGGLESDIEKQRSGVWGMRWRDANGDDVESVGSDPGIIRDQISEQWITLGVTWNPNGEIVFYRGGQEWSRHDIGTLLDPNDRPHDGRYNFHIGGNRGLRWPFHGDIHSVAIWDEQVDEETARLFHKSQHPKYHI